VVWLAYLLLSCKIVDVVLLYTMYMVSVLKKSLSSLKHYFDPLCRESTKPQALSYVIAVF